MHEKVWIRKLRIFSDLKPLRQKKYCHHSVQLSGDVKTDHFAHLHLRGFSKALT